MRVLYHHRTRSKDGQRVHIDELIAALRRLGHDVEVVGPPAAERSSFGDDGGAVARLKKLLPRALYELLEIAYNVVAYRRLRRAFDRFRPDVIYERYNLHTLAGTWLRRRTGVPLLLEVNAPLAEERDANGGLALPGLAHAVERTIWRSADVVLPVTDVLAGHVRRAGVPIERIAVVPNGIDPERFAPRDTAQAKRLLGLDGATVLGFTGFMRPWHGLDRILRLMAGAGLPPEVRLLLVGDGPARPELERLAAELGLGTRVRFAGLVSRDRIADYVAAFDIALQPAVVPYASPLKLFEYMALGKAIVAPAQANIREVLTDGVDAFLFDPHGKEDFSRAIERAIRDPAERARRAAAARATLEARDFTWDANARRVAALSRQLVPARPAGAGSVLARVGAPE